MASEQLPEKEIFTKHYASLCSTLTDINELLPFFVQEDIISFHTQEEISTIVTTQEKVQKLLSHISGPLTAGDATGFQKMLTVMKDHGIQDTKDLAIQINSEIKTLNIEGKCEEVHCLKLASEQLMENEIFTKHYASLCSTLTDINELLPFFVQENVITALAQEEISTITITEEKVKKLLSHISASLTAGDATGFQKMLTVMKYHGIQDTKYLAMQINSEIKALNIEGKCEEKNLVQPDQLEVWAEKYCYKWIDEVDADQMQRNTQILLVTANQHEYNAVLSLLDPVKNSKLLKYKRCYKIGSLRKIATYVFGKFGAFNVAVHKMVAQGPAAAQDVITVSSSCFGDNLNAIIAIGVACGVENKSDYLDVLVSDKITFYQYADTIDNYKLTITNRDVANLPTSSFLLDVFNQPPQWPINNNSETVAKLTKKPVLRFGTILSGNKLVYNKKFKEELLENVSPEAIGIEMEGAGLFHNCSDHNCEILIVKSVCDFGDGKKDKKYLPTAALLAAECVKHYLSDDHLPQSLRDHCCRSGTKLIQMQQQTTTDRPSSVLAHYQSQPAELLDSEKKLELQKEVFTNCRQYIVQYLNPNDILDHLISKHLIGENASQELGLPIKTAQEKNRTIVNELYIGGPDTFGKFCEILKNTSRTKHIADHLEKEWRRLLQPSPSDTEQTHYSTLTPPKKRKRLLQPSPSDTEQTHYSTLTHTKTTQPLPVSPKQQVGFAVAHGLDQLEVNKQKSEEKLGKKQPLEAIDYDTGQDKDPNFTSDFDTKESKVYAVTFCNLPVVYSEREECPIKDCQPLSKIFDHHGGELNIEEHDVTITVPELAVPKGEKVEVKAVASLIGPYKLPEDYDYVSVFVWIGSDYRFKKQVKIRIPHFASIENSDCKFDNIVVLTANMKDQVPDENGNFLLQMHKEQDDRGDFLLQMQKDVYYDVQDYFCDYYTYQFCSKCVARRSIQNKSRVTTFFYRSVDFATKRITTIDLCICYSMKHCLQTVQKQYKQRNMELIHNNSYSIDIHKYQRFCLSHTDHAGWNIHPDCWKIKVKELDYTELELESLKEEEKLGTYPPRFHLTINSPHSFNEAVNIEFKITLESDVPDFVEACSFLSTWLGGPAQDLQNSRPSRSSTACASTQTAPKYLKLEEELRSMVPEQSKLSTESAQRYIDETKILIITANENEYNAVLCFLYPREPDSDIHCYVHKLNIGFISKELHYIFGRFGAFNAAVHILTSQGPAAAQSAVTAASICFSRSLKAIFAVGVACGVKEKTHLLDVIVAKEVSLYTKARYSTTKDGESEIESRSPARVEVSTTFLAYFLEQPHWTSESSDIRQHFVKQPKMHIKEILSGNYLIDNEAEQQNLLEAFAPNAYAIEMEGAGLFHDHKNHNVEFMLVKAVCDFGDGNKSKVYQPTAALLAAECVHHYLNKGKLDPKHFTYTTDSLEVNISDVITSVNTKEYTLHDNDEAQQQCGKVKLLLITKNDNEFNAVLYHMAKKHIEGKKLEEDDIPKFLHKDCMSFYIGNFSEIPVALVKLDQSSQSYKVSCVAMKTFANLKAIVPVGVCTTFGKRGDVIVSTNILIYQHYEKNTPNPVSQLLLSYLKIKSNWEFKCIKSSTNNEHQPKIQYKPFLSLSTSEAFQELTNKIRKDKYEDAEEIDMEGSGIVEAIKKYKEENKGKDYFC